MESMFKNHSISCMLKEHLTKTNKKLDAKIEYCTLKST